MLTFNNYNLFKFLAINCSQMIQSTPKSSRFEQVFYNTGVGIMVVDKDRVLIEVNPKFCEMLGFTKEELLGKNAEIIHLSTEKYKEFGEKAFNLVRNNKTVNLDWPCKRKNGQTIWCRISGDPVIGADEVLWTVIDITQRVSSQKRIEELTNKLSKYLSPQVYQSIFSGKQNVKIEAYRKKLTVFFSDIKGFTEITDRLEPEVLSSLLNSYLNEMSKIALKYGGTIDKFIGDAILIFFGDPESKGDKEDAKACVLMALEMRERMKHLRKLWEDQGISNPLDIRIGINTGFCNVGNFGSEDRLDYTIIGGEVNLASRLESNAEIGQILISHETYALVKKDVICQQKDEINVKGIAHKIQTYQIDTPYNKIDHKRKLLNEEFDGFNLNIDLNVSKKSKVINSLEKILEKLKKENKRN
ncbi:adenylate/guanylate cyclase domain-containing protein [Alphaproteobacteria bacterium]|nr:adenylate/guanylate cyclase domain-containing protein [Alphaproteobacteria bacterium]